MCYLPMSKHFCSLRLLDDGGAKPESMQTSCSHWFKFQEILQYRVMKLARVAASLVIRAIWMRKSEPMETIRNISIINTYIGRERSGIREVLFSVCFD